MISQKVLQEACTISGKVQSVPRSPVLSKSPIPYFYPEEKIEPESVPIFPEVPIVEEKKETVMVETHPNKSPVIVETNQLCPCIVITKNKEKRICGNKAKYNGYCGIHKVKCNLPSNVPVPPKPPSPARLPPKVPSPKPARLPEEPQLVKRIVEAEIVEVKEESRCPCMIMSKKVGEPARICGRKIKAHGRCGIHQRTCHLPEVVAPAPLVPSVVEEKEKIEELKCSCIIKKTKQVCGRKVLAGSDRCGRHQKTCFKIGVVEETRAPLLLSPVYQQSAQVPLSPEAQKWQELEAEMEAEEEKEPAVKVKDVVIQSPDIPPETEPIETGWTELKVSSLDEISNFINQLDKQPAVNLYNIKDIEDKISACLAIK